MSLISRKFKASKIACSEKLNLHGVRIYEKGFVE